MKDANLVLQAAVTQTAGANSTGVDLKAVRPGMVLDIEAIATTVSGTSPTLSITVQESADNTTYRTIGTLAPALTAAGVLRGTVRPVQRYIRTVSTIGGTSPSIVWSAAVAAARP